MASSRVNRSVRTIHALLLVLFVTHINGHMEMVQPYPIDSNLNPQVPYYQKDYSYTSPLLADGSNFPCKGYQNQRPIIRTASYKQGETYEMQLAGTANHDGGSCQISLSYDNGKTFRVIKSMIGGCPLQTSYNFTIPDYAPVGSPLLAWTWMNEVGNREYYMNCAWVEIQPGVVKKPIFGPGSGFSTSSSNRKQSAHKDASRQKHHKQHEDHQDDNRSYKSAGKSHRRKSPRSASLNLVNGPRYNSFAQLPFIWKANIPPVNNCKTIEGQDVVFTNPGPDVEYGNGYSASSPNTPNTGCDTPGPPGPAYKKMKIGPYGSFDHPGSGGPSSTSEIFPPTSTIPIPSQTLPPVQTQPTTLATLTTPTISIPSPTLPPYSSPTLPDYTSPTLPSPTLSVPGVSVPFPTATGTTGKSCDSGIPGQGFKCLRKGFGFAICDNNVWVDMGQTAYGTKCAGQPGAGIIVPYQWES